ncbi:hypothetical protein [Bifidobacterium crudilactis]|uniref:hypothetical protein n=1 Tax=Bifidobacterium crudilactis TaxID=327277 RepID=UPI003A5C035C
MGGVLWRTSASSGRESTNRTSPVAGSPTPAGFRGETGTSVGFAGTASVATMSGSSGSTNAGGAGLRVGSLSGVWLMAISPPVLRHRLTARRSPGDSSLSGSLARMASSLLM